MGISPLEVDDLPADIYIEVLSQIAHNKLGGLGIEILLGELCAQLASILDPKGKYNWLDFAYWHKPPPKAKTKEEELLDMVKALRGIS